MVEKNGIKRPTTITAAVDQLLLKLPLRDKVLIAKMEEQELTELSFSALGLLIRSEFGLWFENRELLAACNSISGQEGPLIDNASIIVIRELWRRLRETHLLRVAE